MNILTECLVLTMWRSLIIKSCSMPKIGKLQEITIFPCCDRRPIYTTGSKTQIGPLSFEQHLPVSNKHISCLSMKDCR